MAESKEKLIERQPSISESNPIVEIRRDEVELPKNVETWLERVEKAKPTTITDTSTGQPVLQPSAPVNPVVKVPVTRKSFSEGFKAGVDLTKKWLSTYIFRLLKIKKGEVEFKEE